MISGNGSDGVQISGEETDGTTVTGNMIGTNQAGTNGLANTGNGVHVLNFAPPLKVTATIIGGSTAGAGNVISSNGSDGILVEGRGVSGITIQGNMVGLGADGDANLGNVGDGVEADEPMGNFLLGGSTAAARNVISDNGEYGARLGGFVTAYQMKGNFIGTDDEGTTAIGNGAGFEGVIVQGDNSVVGGTVGTTPGGSCSGECNLILRQSGCWPAHLRQPPAGTRDSGPRKLRRHGRHRDAGPRQHVRRDLRHGSDRHDRRNDPGRPQHRRKQHGGNQARRRRDGQLDRWQLRGPRCRCTHGRSERAGRDASAGLGQRIGGPQSARRTRSRTTEATASRGSGAAPTTDGNAVLGTRSMGMALSEFTSGRPA